MINKKLINTFKLLQIGALLLIGTLKEFLVAVFVFLSPILAVKLSFFNWFQWKRLGMKIHRPRFAKTTL